MRCTACDIATAERRCFVCGRDLEIRGGLHLFGPNRFEWRADDLAQIRRNFAAGEYPV